MDAFQTRLRNAFGPYDVVTKKRTSLGCYLVVRLREGGAVSSARIEQFAKENVAVPSVQGDCVGFYVTDYDERAMSPLQVVAVWTLWGGALASAAAALWCLPRAW